MIIASSSNIAFFIILSLLPPVIFLPLLLPLSLIKILNQVFLFLFLQMNYAQFLLLLFATSSFTQKSKKKRYFYSFYLLLLLYLPFMFHLSSDYVSFINFVDVISVTFSITLNIRMLVDLGVLHNSHLHIVTVNVFTDDTYPLHIQHYEAGNESFFSLH